VTSIGSTAGLPEIKMPPRMSGDGKAAAVDFPRLALCAAIFLMIVGIFSFDMTTAQDEVLIGFLYVIPITLTFFQRGLRCPIAFGLLATAFIIVGSFFQLPTTHDLIVLLANRSVAILCIGLCVLVMHYRIQAEQRLERLVQEERRKSAVQRARMATISHEFRTPLTIIDGHAQYLLATGFQSAESSAARLDAIRNSVKRILGLVEGVLLSDQVEQDMLALQRSPMDLGTFVAEVCGQRKLDSLNDRIMFSGPMVRLPVSADKKLMRYVFDNILSNAEKYSAEGSKIEVEAFRDGLSAVVTFRDSGIGIPQKELGQLFQRYFRASNAYQFSGNGVGLHLAHTIVESHGGTLAAESVLGNGSVFSVRLPLAVPGQFGDDR